MIASTLTWNKIFNHISVSQNRVIPGIEFKITDCSVYADGSDCKSIFTMWDYVAAISKSFLWLQVGLFSLIEAENFGPENSPSNEIGRGCQMQDLFSVICNFVVSN